MRKVCIPDIFIFNHCGLCFILRSYLLGLYRVGCYDNWWIINYVRFQAFTENHFANVGFECRGQERWSHISTSSICLPDIAFNLFGKGTTFTEHNIWSAPRRRVIFSGVPTLRSWVWTLLLACMFFCDFLYHVVLCSWRPYHVPIPCVRSLAKRLNDL
jgi:hypothetical protein